MTRPPPGDEESSDRIGRLYDRFGESLYRYALMILADHAAASDVIQQVFTALLRQPRAIERDERYLRCAVRNESFSVLRSRRREGASALEVSLLESAVADDRPEERLAIEQAIRLLPPEQREVLHLKTFEGLTFREIAELTGESLNTVASRYRYAIEKLRLQLTALR